MGGGLCGCLGFCVVLGFMFSFILVVFSCVSYVLVEKAGGCFALVSSLTGKIMTHSVPSETLNSAPLSVVLCSVVICRSVNK